MLIVLVPVALTELFPLISARSQDEPVQCSKYAEAVIPVVPPFPTQDSSIFALEVFFFVNVSESEGIPVSIMEAASFGIPIIATDVGGTSEIVDNSNGFLIENNKLIFEDVAFYLESALSLGESEYMSRRVNSRKKWLELYNSSNNFEYWYRELITWGNKK